MLRRDTLITQGGRLTHKIKSEAKPPCIKNEMLDTPVRNADNPE